MFTQYVLSQVVPPLIALLVGAAIVWLAATSERFAAPARAKNAADRGVLDRAAIKADELIDAQIAALDREQLQEFFTNFLLQHLRGSGILHAATAANAHPNQSPDAEAIVDKLLPEAKTALVERNPTLAGRTQLTTKSLKDLLVARVNQAIVTGRI